MDIEKLKLAGVNYDEGLKRFANKSALYEKFLAKFFNDATFADLGEKLKSGDYEAAFKDAHTLKGTSGNLSLHTFYETLCPLVEELRGGSGEHSAEYYAKLEEIYNQLKTAIVE